MRKNSSPTDRSLNFEERLKVTWNSELEPEMVTPNTAGAEELPYEENFTLIEQFKQTNMKPGGPRPRGTQRQQGRSND